MAFNATWAPGPEAVAGMQVVGIHHNQPALVMYLDQDSIAITTPGGPATWPEFVRFLRELRDAADEMVKVLQIEPGEPGT